MCAACKSVPKYLEVLACVTTVASDGGGGGSDADNGGPGLTEDTPEKKKIAEEEKKMAQAVTEANKVSQAVTKCLSDTGDLIDAIKKQDEYSWQTTRMCSGSWRRGARSSRASRANS